MNNFDKIKNMTLDEMAELLSTDCALRCPKYMQYKKCYGNCQENVKQWLQAESEEQTNEK